MPLNLPLLKETRCVKVRKSSSFKRPSLPYNFLNVFEGDGKKKLFAMVHSASLCRKNSIFNVQEFQLSKTPVLAGTNCTDW